MTTTPTPPPAATNRAGLTKADYDGAKTTLCPGCGHNAITSAIIQAAFESALEPSKLAKLSGIGCSSKTPAYFIGQSHGFNAVHGRMPSIATGVRVANRELLLIGVSGDGDTASIGLGQFCHLVRRNVPVVYIVENNGVYGLTKGQFSATADIGSTTKGGRANELMPIDLCALAIELGCGFVARSFSGDPKQLRPLLKAAFAHRGTAVLDIISPCVTFNNKDDSTKSYGWGREHDDRINDFTYVPPQEEIRVDYAPGERQEVTMHDGSTIVLRKLDESHDPTDRYAALKLLEEAREQQHFITGLIYVDGNRPSLAEHERLGSTPLAYFGQDQLRPSRQSLDKIMSGMK